MLGLVRRIYRWPGDPILKLKSFKNSTVHSKLEIVYTCYTVLSYITSYTRRVFTFPSCGKVHGTGPDSVCLAKDMMKVPIETLFPTMLCVALMSW